MAYTIAGALLPIVITFLLGFVGAWRGDFQRQDASILNRLVLTYALPLMVICRYFGYLPRIIGDIFAYTSRHMPKFNSISISGPITPTTARDHLPRRAPTNFLSPFASRQPLV